MVRMMSACGVMCSECPAYLAESRGVAHQKRTAAAWRRIYNLSELFESISCGGCLGPDDELFHTSRTCKARRCCRSKSFGTCAECPETACADLEKAQSVWDDVPDLAATLSRQDFVAYAKAYSGHRRRLVAARRSARG